MQDRFLGQRVTVGDMEKLRTLRHLKMAIQKELKQMEKKQCAAPLDILFIMQRQKEVQKALDKLENYLFSIELYDQ
jgi:hypothetical protein